MCRRIVSLGLSALLSMFVVGHATAQTSGANWLEQLFRPPQHIPPSFTRPGVNPSQRDEPAIEEEARPRAGAVSKRTREADSQGDGTATQGKKTASAKRTRSDRLGTVRATWYQHRGRTATGERFIRRAALRLTRRCRLAHACGWSIGKPAGLLPCGSMTAFRARPSTRLTSREGVRARSESRMREWPQWLFTNCVEERLPGPIRRSAAFRFPLARGQSGSPHPPNNTSL